MEDGEKAGLHFQGSVSLAVDTVGWKAVWEVPRRCLEGDAGERGQNKRKRPEKIK